MDSFTRRRLRAVVYVLCATGCAMWLLYLFCQIGSIWDEPEHAHAAWLISRGKHPGADFFQHHQPLLWGLLSLYYRAGFTGAGVLVWGRVLVVACGVVSIMALLALGGSQGGTPAPLRVNIAGIVGAGVLIGLTLLLPELFVSRPETLSTALILIALALWSNETGAADLRILAAGALAGAACYSSPRFIVLGGLFLLCGTNRIRRWVVLLCGGVLFVAAYTLISGFPLERVVFNLRFSSFLQSIGDHTVGRPEEFWTLLDATVVLPMMPLIVVRSSERLRRALLIANLAAIFVVCNHLAGFFYYSQAYAPFVTAAAFVATSLLARLEVPDGKRTWVAVCVGFFMLLASVGRLYALIARPEFGFFREVEFKNVLAAMVPPGRTVLVYSARNPITVADASYYGTPLYDGQDRLCRAIRGFQASPALPPCDFFRVIQATRPYILDARINRAVRPEEAGALKQWLGEHYEYLRFPPDFPVAVRLRYPLLIEKPAN